MVTPMEVVKIRLQAQSHSLADPLDQPVYRNAGHAVYKIVREEGFARSTAGSPSPPCARRRTKVRLRIRRDSRGVGRGG